MELLKNNNFHILIVEDDPKSIKLMGKALKEENFNLSVLRDGNDVLGFERFESIDLILLDINLPHKNGLEIEFQGLITQLYANIVVG